MDELLGLLILLLFAAGLLILLLTGLLVREARRPPRHTAGYAVARGLPCDPGDLNMAYEEWWLDRPAGVRLPVWEIEPGEGTEGLRDEGTEETGGGGLTAVFIHGWGQSRIDMLARVGPWPALCRRLVLYDSRGHGDAEGGLSDLGYREEEDLLALLEQLGGGPFLLVGHSMGAVIAMHAAAAAGHPVVKQIIGIVAYGPYCDFHQSLRGRLHTAGYPTRPMTDLAMLGFKLGGLRHKPTESAAAALACPLLVIHGTEDIVSPPRRRTGCCMRWRAPGIWTPRSSTRPVTRR
jgi:pimeloyl-ACP methyl ester carboxylesterase